MWHNTSLICCDDHQVDYQSIPISLSSDTENSQSGLFLDGVKHKQDNT